MTRRRLLSGVCIAALLTQTSLGANAAWAIFQDAAVTTAPVISSGAVLQGATLPLSTGQNVGTIAATNNPTSWTILGGDWGLTLQTPSPYFAISSSGVVTITAEGASSLPTCYTTLFISATNSAGTSYGWADVFIGGGNLSLSSSGFLQVAAVSPTGTPSQSPTGSRQIYVSSSTGSDSNTGTEAAPFATLAHASGFMRVGFPDQLYLKAGDTWTNDSFSGLATYAPAGASATSIAAIQFYGTGNRPIVQAGENATIVPLENSGSSPTTNSGSYLAIIGIKFYAYLRDPANGSFEGDSTAANDSATAVTCNSNTPWIWVEDCDVSYFYTNFAIGGVATYSDGAQEMIAGAFYCLRRNIIQFAYFNGRSQGVSGGGYQFQTCNENIFNANGYSTNAGLVAQGCGPTNQNRNLYWNNVPQVVTNPGGGTNSGFDYAPACVANGNLMFASSSGHQFRCGVWATNNLLQGNMYCGLNIGCNVDTDAGLDSAPAHVTLVSQNVILESQDIGSESGTGGQGIVYNACTGNGTISGVCAFDNIIAHAESATSAANEGWVLGTSNSYTKDVVSEVLSENNIVFNVDGQLFDPTYSSSCTNTGNVYDQNGTNSSVEPPEPFTHPAPTAPSSTSLVGDYYYSINGGTSVSVPAFIAAAVAARTLQTWPEQYSAYAVLNYIQVGYDVDYSSL